MSTQPQPPRGSHPDAPHGPVEPPPAASFRKKFLITQVVFLVFVLIASIPEGLSPYNRVEAAVQVAVIGGLWVLIDTAALAIRAIRVLARRAGR